LIENYPTTNISFDQLHTLQYPSDKPFILAVEWDGIKFEFLIRIKPTSSHMFVMGSGAMNFNEDRVKPPYFQRHSWIDDFEDSLIYYNDPTLYLGDHLLVGWGQGTKDRFYLKDIAAILDILIQKAKVPSKNVIFYGSSAGGFMSLLLAGYIKESIAFVNSPQTCLTKWIKTPVRQVLEISYPKLSQEKIIELYPERINVVEFYNKIKYVPKIYYLQNVFCEIDILGHLTPFLEGIQKIDNKSLVNRIKIDLYYLPKKGLRRDLAGHGAVGKDETIMYLNKMKTEF
jgi:hypothetical protein